MIHHAVLSCYREQLKALDFLHKKSLACKSIETGGHYFWAIHALNASIYGAAVDVRNFGQLLFLTEG